MGNDPELRHTPNGTPVASFSLATNRKWNGPDGKQQEKTTWFRCSAWQKQAEVVKQYLTKGNKVMVIGEVEEAHPYTDHNGEQRASIEVTIRTIKFITGTNPGERIRTSALGHDPIGEFDPGHPLGDMSDIPF